MVRHRAPRTTRGHRRPHRRRRRTTRIATRPSTLQLHHRVRPLRRHHRRLRRPRTRPPRRQRRDLQTPAQQPRHHPHRHRRPQARLPRHPRPRRPMGPPHRGGRTNRTLGPLAPQGRPARHPPGRHRPRPRRRPLPHGRHRHRPATHPPRLRARRRRRPLQARHARTTANPAHATLPPGDIIGFATLDDAVGQPASVRFSARITDTGWHANLLVHEPHDDTPCQGLDANAFAALAQGSVASITTARGVGHRIAAILSAAFTPTFAFHPIGVVGRTVVVDHGIAGLVGRARDRRVQTRKVASQDGTQRSAGHGQQEFRYDGFEHDTSTGPGAIQRAAVAAGWSVTDRIPLPDGGEIRVLDHASHR